MMTAWVAYGLAVGALVAAAARGFETVARGAGLPLRWVWAGALPLLMVLVALAPARSARPSATFSPERSIGDVIIEEISVPRPAPAAGVSGPAGTPRIDLGGWMTGPLAAIARLTPRGLDRAIAAGWLASTLIALGLMGGTHYRIRERRRRWPISLLHGERVRVSDDFGPAVIGVGRGEIVVPRWLLELPPEDSRLVVAHEVEHVRARDSLLLFLGWTAAGLLAWNPAAWWMLSRLRLAVEVDCDSRMLRRGAVAHVYGALLIRLVDRYPGPRRATLTLAGRRTHLERRLRAMTSPAHRHAPFTTAVALLAVTAVVVACDARMPASDELTAPDVVRGAALPESVRVPPAGAGDPAATGGMLAPAAGGGGMTVGVGSVATPEVASAGPVGTAAAPGASAGTGDSPGGAAQEEAAEFRYESAGVTMPEPTVVRESRPPPNPFGPAPVPGGDPAAATPGSRRRTVVYLVDGVRTDVPDNSPIVPGHPMYGIAGSDIEQIAVLMCEQATRIVAEAVDGLVVVRTKDGPDDGIVLPASRHLRVSSGTLRAWSCDRSLSRATIDAALKGTGMLIVDGIRATHEEALAIPAAAIFSISLPQRSVTPQELVEEYGPDAAEGVAVVATRAGDWRPASGITP